jgi:hypothetical protein
MIKKNRFKPFGTVSKKDRFENRFKSDGSEGFTGWYCFQVLDPTAD